MITIVQNPFPSIQGHQKRYSASSQGKIHGMTIRPFQLPADLDLMISIIKEGFQYPENPEWSIQEDELQSMVDQLNGIKRIWLLMYFLAFLFPFFRDLFRGFIYEEDGKAGGLINFMRQQNEPEWMIGNVTVVPEFRRRGIARKLVDATLQEIRERNGRVAILDVVDGNLPAHTLYKEMGFEDYTGSSQYDYMKDELVSPVPLSEGFTLSPVKVNAWRILYEFAKRVTPGNITKFEQVSEKRFQSPLIVRMLGPLIDKLGGAKMERFVLRKADNGQIIGWMRLRYRTRPGGVNSVNVQLDPQFPELAQPMLSHAITSIQTASPGRRIEIQLNNWQPALLEAAATLGCEKRLSLYRMGLLFTNGH